jgi:hypothetical protein
VHHFETESPRGFEAEAGQLLAGRAQLAESSRMVVIARWTDAALPSVLKVVSCTSAGRVGIRSLQARRTPVE